MEKRMKKISIFQANIWLKANVTSSSRKENEKIGLRVMALRKVSLNLKKLQKIQFETFADR